MIKMLFYYIMTGIHIHDYAYITCHCVMDVLITKKKGKHLACLKSVN